MMKEFSFAFKNEMEKQALVRFGEERFRTRLSDTVNEIAERSELRLITVSGPSCAGKTMGSAKLEQALRAHGHRVQVISIDDFFLDRDFLTRRAEERGEKLDFDSPDTIDFALLSSVIDAIVSGRSASLPCFSFSLGKRTGYRTLAPAEEDDIYLIEGIQAVYPAVTACFGANPYLSLFICPTVGLRVADESLDAADIRFLRRLVRDAKFRSASPEFTFSIWETVRRNEIVNIFPNLSEIDYTIDSYLAYELPMIRPFAEPLLREITRQSSHYDSAQRYLRILSEVEPISDGYLPKDSLFREFIG